MHTQISVHDKKEFIQWFLNNYQLKKRESVWILNYLLNHDEILEHVHFVQDVTLCPRAIIMTCFGSDDVPFRFNKHQVVTADADKSFHDIRLNNQEPLFVQLNFKNANQSSVYASVLEENPYLPDKYNITVEDSQLASELLDESLKQFAIKKYKILIDQALDNHDSKAFMIWTSKLNQLINKD